MPTENADLIREASCKIFPVLTRIRICAVLFSVHPKSEGKFVRANYKSFYCANLKGNSGVNTSWAQMKEHKKSKGMSHH